MSVAVVPDVRAKTDAPAPGGGLRIIHCFRSPVGGIFRHVRDLIEYQHAAGHAVGIVCDSTTGGRFEEDLFDQIRPQLTLGLTRIPMRRAVGPGDLLALWRTYRHLRAMEPHILHAHGAKGGAYARIIGTAMRASGANVSRLYCPHGGSIHYDASTLGGRAYFAMERLLGKMTDRLIFVSRYERDGYIAKVGRPASPVSVVHNGLRPSEYKRVAQQKNAADFLYVGMMRDLKGPDLFLRALAAVEQSSGRALSAHLVGDGPDKSDYVALAEMLGLGDRVRFHPAMPAREAFKLARTLVVPSRAESMPYIVLEAIAAQMPIVATRVGGIPEIFENEVDALVEADDVGALATAMAAGLASKNAAATARARAERLKRRFSVETMSKAIDRAYRETL